jgi:hypothetical protein
VGLLTSCTAYEDNPTTSQELFEQEMTAALADAQVYGPQTDAIAREVAARFNGCVTDINYKTRESATRKCITDNSRPYDLKDLARTTIVAGWDSTEIKPVINYLVSTATERNIFGRYKHQTSDYDLIMISKSLFMIALYAQYCGLSDIEKEGLYKVYKDYMPAFLAFSEFKASDPKKYLVCQIQGAHFAMHKEIQEYKYYMGKVAMLQIRKNTGPIASICRGGISAVRSR